MAQLSAQQLRKLHIMGVRVWQDRTRRPAVAKTPGSDLDVGPNAQLDTAGDRQGATTSHPATRRQQTVSPSNAPARAASPPADVANHDWQMLRATVSTCTLCALSDTRTKTVFGVGAEQADLMIVGEAPGAEEDRRGEPFVGRAGQLLDAMLASIAHSRKNVFIANILKCRPPGNRDPQTDEAHACSGYLNRQIDLVQPKAIVAVGRIAAQRLLGSTASLARLRGKVHHYGANKTPLIVTYHPAYLLRSPGQKRKAWEDLMFAVGVLNDNPSERAPS